MTAPSDPRGYCKGGIGLQQTRCRLTRLRVASKMAEGGRETSATCRIGGALKSGLLRCNNGLVKTTKLNKGASHTREGEV